MYSFPHLDVTIANVIKNKSAYSSHIFTFCFPCWHLEICSCLLQLSSLKLFYVSWDLLLIFHNQVNTIHILNVLSCFNDISPLSYSELRLFNYCLMLTQVVSAPTLKSGLNKNLGSDFIIGIPNFYWLFYDV